MKYFICIILLCIYFKNIYDQFYRKGFFNGLVFTWFFTLIMSILYGLEFTVDNILREAISITIVSIILSIFHYIIYRRTNSFTSFVVVHILLLLFLILLISFYV